MYKYCATTTIVIKGKIYQDLVIYKSVKEINNDIIRYDTVNRYFDKLLKCDEYRIDIVRMYEEK